MNKLKNLLLILTVIAGLNVFAATQLPTPVNTKGELEKSVPKTCTVSNAVSVNPLTLVARPSAYLNKNVKITVEITKPTIILNSPKFRFIFIYLY